MGDKSSIEWTDATWNPVTGCSKVSPGCAHCYAEALTRRYAKAWGVPGLPWTPANAAENVILRPDRLEQPLRWKKPRMVFVNSMSDLFHEQVPIDYIARIFAVMRLATEHTFQVLTKRPERMREVLTNPLFPLLVADAIGTDHQGHEGVIADPHVELPNVWLGVSIENRRYVDRADVLRETPAAVRFISAEPLLGPLVAEGHHVRMPGLDAESLRDEWWEWPDDYEGPDLNLNGINWLIVGGESGPGARSLKGQWVRDLQDIASMADTAFFFKQWGGRTPKANGRELDGRTWDEMPAAVPCG